MCGTKWSQPKWGQGALVTEKQFEGTDPKVIRAGAERENAKENWKPISLLMGEGGGPGLNVKADEITSTDPSTPKCS